MSLFGYYSLGLQSMNVARLGMQVAGDNISNVFTPGYARRSLDLSPGYPVAVSGGFLDSGVDVARLRRMEDRFLQASFEREQGKQAGSEELLRGLGHLETLFGPLDDPGGISAALGRFSEAFTELASQPEDPALRRGAVSAASGLARSISDTYSRLAGQRSLEDQNVAASVERVNALSAELAALNNEITVIEGGATGTAGPLLDRRNLVVEELSQLTGGSAYTDSNGRLSFAISGGPTLVSGDKALPLSTSRATDGTLRIHSGADGSDITDRVRDGRLGAQLYLRDDELPGRLDDLDALASDLTTRANALTTAAFDLDGNPGIALFRPDPPIVPGAGRDIVVNPALADDPDLLAVSSTGAPGESDVALSIAALTSEASVTLNDRSPTDFVAGMLADLGEEVVAADVAASASTAVLDSLAAQRDAVSGVSLDEEAVQLVQFQQSFEAAARFIQVLNNITATAISIVD